jgi:CRISPR-associated protein Cas2
MFTVVVYDIAESKRLAKIAKIMKDYGVRVQYSVFELYMDHEDLDEMMGRALEIMDEKKDSVRIYPLCKKCEKQTEFMGNAVYTEEEPDVLIL